MAEPKFPKSDRFEAFVRQLEQDKKIAPRESAQVLAAKTETDLGDEIAERLKISNIGNSDQITLNRMQRTLLHIRPDLDGEIDNYNKPQETLGQDVRKAVEKVGVIASLIHAKEDPIISKKGHGKKGREPGK